MTRNELEDVLTNMQPRQWAYEMIKAELKKRGRWKAKGRGKPFDRGQDPRRGAV